MIKFWVRCVCGLICSPIGFMFAQQNSLPMHTFYKDKFLENTPNQSVETFFPATENQLNLHRIIRDSSVQYYDISEWLFKKHWVNFSNSLGSISMSPMVDFTLGKETTDTSGQRLFRNTRGVYVEGELLKRIGFNFIFAENQARFMNYESDYFRSRGEKYVGSVNYSTQNAVIPGGSRTKPFKGNAFDYAYSMGSIHFQASKQLDVEFGNTPQFIGVGYRSLMLSDNGLGALFFRTKWKISDRWSYQMMFRKNNNLYRKPLTQQVESAYESKLFGMTYLTFKPIQNLSISLFSAGNQLRGDSLVKHGLALQMIAPIPLIQNDLIFGNSVLFNGISGINIDFAWKQTRFYGQLVADKIGQKHVFAGQLGAHFFKIASVKNLHAQVEVNVIPKDFYADKNPKLSYSHFNLPLAHIKGNNVGEIIFRADYEVKRVFLAVKSVYYAGLSGNDSIPMTSNSIFEMQFNVPNQTATTFIQEFELGYRINRKYNATFSIGWKGRFYQSPVQNTEQQMIFIGLKTGIFNQYLDF